MDSEKAYLFGDKRSRKELKYCCLQLSVVEGQKQIYLVTRVFEERNKKEQIKT